MSIIKAFFDYCKSNFFYWIIDNIWKLLKFKEVAIVMYISALVQSIPSFYWIPIILFTLFLFINVVNGFIVWYNYFQKPALEVIYANGKYNGEDKKLDECGFYIKYSAAKIGIYNKSKKTIEQVIVIVEYQGKIQQLIHSNTKKDTYNINPGAIEIFIIGELIGDYKGTILTVKASGKDIFPPAEKKVIL